jgi:hypothetical protein
VNDQTKFAVIAVPEVSLTPPVAPPLTVAVYVVPLASGELGVSVAVSVAASYATVAGTLDGPWRVNVLVVIVVESIGLLNVAVTLAPVATAVAPFAGTTEVTVGAIGPEVVNTTSTQ